MEETPPGNLPQASEQPTVTSPEDTEAAARDARDAQDAEYSAALQAFHDKLVADALAQLALEKNKANP